MLDRGRLAVHGGVQLHASPEGLSESLMAEADAERGNARFGHAPDELERDPGLIGGARSGRDHAALVAGGEQLGDGGAIVAHRLDLGAQLPQVLHEVVGERVVVVEDQYLHDHSGCSQASAIARSAACALAADSRYS